VSPDAVVRNGLRLPSDEVHVWRLSLDHPAPVLRQLEGVLSGHERARADRFVFARDRRRYVAAHGQLRHVLAGYLHQRPEAVELTGEAGAKPRVAADPAVRFSLSHSGDLSLVAVASGREVGVDVEELRPVDDPDDLVVKCFSELEREEWATVPEGLRQPVFLETWTRKEALLKALGEGLSRRLSCFAVTVAPGRPARILRFEEEASVAGRFELHPLRPGPGYVGTLAVEGRGLRVLSLEGASLPGHGGEWDEPGRRGGHDDVPGRRQPRGAVFDLAGRQGDPEGLACGGEERAEGGLPGLGQGALGRHDPAEPARGGRGAPGVLRTPVAHEHQVTPGTSP
jgi:4'-phosphopantetheinyl transferase